MTPQIIQNPKKRNPEDKHSTGNVLVTDSQVNAIDRFRVLCFYQGLEARTRNSRKNTGLGTLEDAAQAKTQRQSWSSVAQQSYETTELVLASDWLKKCGKKLHMNICCA